MTREELKIKYANLIAESKISVISPICSLCNNFDLTNPVKRKCRAFPDGIPLEIWKGNNDHTQEFEGDNGIRFEKYVHKNPKIEDLEIEITEKGRKFKLK